MPKKITVWGRYKKREIEKLDQANEGNQLEELLDGYRSVFGKEWKIWSGIKTDEPKERG